MQESTSHCPAPRPKPHTTCHQHRACRYRGASCTRHVPRGGGAHETFFNANLLACLQAVLRGVPSPFFNANLPAQAAAGLAKTDAARVVSAHQARVVHARAGSVFRDTTPVKPPPPSPTQNTQAYPKAPVGGLGALPRCARRALGTASRCFNASLRIRVWCPPGMLTGAVLCFFLKARNPCTSTR